VSKISREQTETGAETWEDRPLKYLSGWDGGAFIPQCLENVIVKETEKEKIRHH